MLNASEPPPLPTDLAAAHALILAERAAQLVSEITVERLKLDVAWLRRERFGASSERSTRIDQLELTLEDLEETLAETDAQVAAEPEASATTAFSRRKPARRPMPEHLPRERIVHPGPAACACCGKARLHLLGEDVTETLKRIPARWVVIQHVRERFSCADCETIAQTPVPFHPIPRGRAGPNFLAEVMMAKFGFHLPLHRQSQRFAHEGVPIDVSTLAGCPVDSHPKVQLAFAGANFRDIDMEEADRVRP